MILPSKWGAGGYERMHPRLHYGSQASGLLFMVLEMTEKQGNFKRMKDASFFARKEQSEFIQRVYQETPTVIRNLFLSENEMLNQALFSCKRILEIGCGFGRAMKSVAKEQRYTGVDIGLNCVLEAKADYPDRQWVCADGTRLPFGNAEFDAVFLIQNTLGNMEGIETKVLREAKRVAGPDGKIILSVYSEDSFEIRRLWYDRLVDIGIFGKVWLDVTNPRIARSDTGWSSRCFDAAELKQYFQGLQCSLEINKLDSFLYFCVAAVQPKT